MLLVCKMHVQYIKFVFSDQYKVEEKLLTDGVDT